MKKYIPKAAPTRWSSNSKLFYFIIPWWPLQTLQLYELSDPDTLVRSNGFYEWLTKDSIYIFLVVYKEVLFKTGALFNVLQAKMMDISILRWKDYWNNEFTWGWMLKFREFVCNTWRIYAEKISKSKSHAKGSVKELKQKILRIFGIILDNMFNMFGRTWRTGKWDLLISKT